jgi:hypothetical protein
MKYLGCPLDLKKAAKAERASMSFLGSGVLSGYDIDSKGGVL